MNVHFSPSLTNHYRRRVHVQCDTAEEAALLVSLRCAYVCSRLSRNDDINAMYIKGLTTDLNIEKTTQSFA